MKDPVDRLFPTRRRVVVLLAPIYIAIAFGLSALSACRACNVAGVFYFCNDEGPHEIVTNPPPAWRARALEVQQELAEFTAARFPDSVFVRRDVDRIVYVRVLGHGIPNGAARVNGDTILFNPEVEGNAGVMRHELVHWIQPNNPWLQPFDAHHVRQIHWPPPFTYVRAPLVAYGG